MKSRSRRIVIRPMLIIKSSKLMRKLKIKSSKARHQFKSKMYKVNQESCNSRIKSSPKKIN